MVYRCCLLKGGRAAMCFALQYPELVDKLVVVDISPAEDRHTFTQQVLSALLRTDISKAKRREEVTRICEDELDVCCVFVLIVD